MADRAIFPIRSHPGLRGARVARKLSQDELSFLSGISQPRLSRAERGYLWLRPHEREKLADVLGVTAAELDGLAPGGDRVTP